MRERWKHCALPNERVADDPADLAHERRLLFDHDQDVFDMDDLALVRG